MPRHVEIDVRIESSADECTHAAARLFAERVQYAAQTRGVARVAISGGSTPKAMLALLGDPAQPFRAVLPWDQLQLFWVDERCVGPEDAESNYGMTRAVLLDKVAELPAANVHRMEGEFDPEEGASRYESEIRNAFRLEGAETPTFDLILLGLGPDGHTASLFPHTAGLHEMARIVIANHVPQKDTWRLTLTWPVIVQGRTVAFLVEGEEKAEMVRTVFTGAYDPETYPAQLVRPASGKLILLLDRAAAVGLDAGLAEGAKSTKLELS